jgi:gamma-glutamylcyclotransferase (GGCT)/AIG2-like uncharacterized protein YtfP
MTDLFVYGSLMLDEVWDRLIRSKHQKLDATVYDFSRYTVTGEVYPGLRYKLHGKVHGVLVRGLNQKELKAIDRFEGHYYTRKRIVADVDGFGKVSCETYLFKKNYLHLLSTTEWSKDAFLEMQLTLLIK